jgi:hypothetical protein
VALISFVIPAFNEDGFVSRAIDSALGQSHTPVEVIVVDDGSTDGTAKALAAYAERPNVTLIRQARAGRPAARNRGLASSRGEFLCFLDAADYLAPTFAARLRAPLVDDSAIGLAYCDVQRVDRFGETADDASVATSRHTLSGDIFDSLILGAYFPASAVLVRRAVLDALGGFDDDLGDHADYELWLRIMGAGHRAAFVGDRLISHRLLPGRSGHEPSAGDMAAPAQETRVAALERIARRVPARLAMAVSAIQEMPLDRASGRAVMRALRPEAPRPSESPRASHTWRALDHFPAARLTDGTPDRLATWDVTIDDVFTRAIFLHPPATLELAVPIGAAGRLATAVAIHPDAWVKRDAGAVQFSVLVDGRISASIVLDPARHESDRRWAAIGLEVPATAASHHTIAIETRAPGVDWYCWALFRDLTFEW